MRQKKESSGQTVTYPKEFIIQKGRLESYVGSNECVVIPEGVTEISEGAFPDANNLMSLTLPSSLRSLRLNFADFPLLQEIVFPDSLETLPDGICSGCPELMSVELPGHLRAIPPRAFSGCVSLTELTLPDGLELIEADAFSDCTALDEIHFPDSLRTIRSGSFSRTALKTVDFPMGMKTIEDGAFARSKVNSLTLPETMHHLGDRAFEGCHIPYLTWRGEDLIYGIWLAFRSSRPDAGLYAPDIKLNNVPVEYKTILCRGFSQRYLQGESVPPEIRARYLGFIRRKRKDFMEDASILSVVLKEGFIPAEELEEWTDRVQTLNRPDIAAMLLDYQGARFSAKRLDQVQETKMRREIDRALREKPTLTELRQTWSWKVFPQIGLCITSWKGTEGTRVEVPREIGDTEVAGIMYRAFSPDGLHLRENQRQARAALEEVILPDTVRVVEEAVFRNCRSLKSICLPKNLTLLGRSCFENCWALKKIVIPEGVTEIRENTFRSCESLEEVTLPAGLLSLKRSAFELCESLQSITLPDGVKTLEDSCFSWCRSLNSITVPASLEKVGQNVFEMTAPGDVTVTGGKLKTKVAKALKAKSALPLFPLP